MATDPFGDLPEKDRAPSSGAIEDFEAKLDEAFADQWGVIRITRGPIEVIDNARRVQKPRRTKITLSINGRPWRSIQLEITFPEGSIARYVESIAAPSLKFFGFENPEGLATIALTYQIAQKFHASTDPTSQDGRRNTRVRDITDLVLTENSFYPDGINLNGIREASEDVFGARADEALQLGLTARYWPPTVIAHAGWEQEWSRLADKTGLDLTLVEALAQVNEWLGRIIADVANGS